MELGWFALVRRLPSVEQVMSSKNILAAIVIVLVLVGGGAALYKLDTGQGNRTSQTVSAKSASD
jgi:hypothetical protein